MTGYESKQSIKSFFMEIVKDPSKLKWLIIISVFLPSVYIADIFFLISNSLTGMYNKILVILGYSLLIFGQAGAIIFFFTKTKKQREVQNDDCDNVEVDK
ncbi:MAG: hypothetical protein ACTSWN_05265 [Promethearchaeota archaeon]